MDLIVQVTKDGIKSKGPTLTTYVSLPGKYVVMMPWMERLGVSHKLELGFSETLSYATEQTIFASTMIFTGLKKLIVGEVPAKELGGVISIVKLTSDATDAGWMSVLFFAALISVNLGVLNLLPIPALDGGHIMFNLYEIITKHAPSEGVLIKLTIAGWVVLFSLMGLGLFNDINRLMG